MPLEKGPIMDRSVPLRDDSGREPGRDADKSPGEGPLTSLPAPASADTSATPTPAPAAPAGTPPAPAPVPAAPATAEPSGAVSSSRYPTEWWDAADLLASPIHIPALVQPTEADSEKLATILRGARESGASDIHLRAAIKPMIRLHGELVQVQVPTLFPDEVERFVAVILSPRQQRAFVDGNDITVAFEAPGAGRFRAQVFRDRRGFGIVFHVIPAKLPTLNELLLPTVLSKAAGYAQGLVLVTGPGGSGRTTTLNILLDQINRDRRVHVVSLERPIEYVHASKNSLITQREVGRHAPSFAKGVRGAVREGADVLLLSEFSDQETIERSLAAARGGTLVLAAMPTRGAVSTLRRLIYGFGAGRETSGRAFLAETLRLIVTQQLVPTRVSKRHVVATEILFNTHEVCSLIHDGRLDDLPAVLQGGSKAGMRYMDDSLIELAGGGLVSVEAAEALAEDKDRFKLTVRRR